MDLTALAALPGDPLHWLLIACIALLLVLWRRAVSRIARGNRRRQRVAADAEERAELLLEDAGYVIVDRQVPGRWPVVVDGVERQVALRADLLVERDGELWIAEVKSGEQAPRPDLPETRRQLLEYLLAFDVVGVLLVDMRAEVIRTVDFPALDLIDR